MNNIYTESNLERVESINSPKKYTESSMRQEGLSIIILNLNKPEYIMPLIENLKITIDFFKINNTNIEILIGDTGTTDKNVLETYDKLPSDFKVINNLNYHFSKNNNEIAFNFSSNDTFLFLNNDIYFKNPTDIYSIYTTLIKEPNLGIAGTVMLFENNLIQHAGIDYIYESEFGGVLPVHHKGSLNINSIENFPRVSYFHAVTGAFLMIKSKLFFDTNGFNEEYKAEAQDVDLCLKVIRLGYSIALIKEGTIYHYENGTRKKGEVSNADRKLFMRKWTNFIKYGMKK